MGPHEGRAPMMGLVPLQKEDQSPVFSTMGVQSGLQTRKMALSRNLDLGLSSLQKGEKECLWVSATWSIVFCDTWQAV